MRARIAMTMAIGILVALSGLVRAQSGGDHSAEFTLSAAKGLGVGYDLTWYTIDNGGINFSTSGGYQLRSAIGQPDAGSLSGGDYTLASGFFGGETASEPAEEYIYLPIVLR